MANEHEYLESALNDVICNDILPEKEIKVIIKSIHNIDTEKIDDPIEKEIAIKLNGLINTDAFKNQNCTEPFSIEHMAKLMTYIVKKYLIKKDIP